MTALFSGSPTHEYEQQLRERIRKTILSADLPQINEGSETLEAAAVRFVTAFTLEPPALPPEGQPAQPSAREFEEMNDGRFSRLGRPFLEKLMEYTIVIPIEGDAKLLSLSPNTAPFGLGLVGDTELRGQTIVYKHRTPSQTPREQLARAIQNDLSALRRHVEAIRSWAMNWNTRLAEFVRALIAQRHAELKRQSEQGTDLNISF